MVWVGLSLLTMGGYGDGCISSSVSNVNSGSTVNTTQVPVPIDKSLLFCFDFGGTLIKGSLMRDLEKCSSEAEKIDVAAAFFMNAEKGWTGGKERISDVLNKILDAGHYIAITSFGLYPEILKKNILELGIPEGKIFILRCTEEDLKPDYPSCPLINENPQGKARYISVAMDHFGLDVKEVNRVILIDDSIKNIEIAKNDGIHTIQADGTGSFYQACLDMIGLT